MMMNGTVLGKARAHAFFRITMYGRLGVSAFREIASIQFDRRQLPTPNPIHKTTHTHKQAELLHERRARREGRAVVHSPEDQGGPGR